MVAKIRGNNLSALNYNMMMASDGDYKLRAFHDDSGQKILSFPTTANSFWFLDCSTVEQLLAVLHIDHRHCQTDDDRRRELGMHIGVHPDWNPQKKTTDQKIDELLVKVTELEGNVTEIEEKVDETRKELGAVMRKVSAVRASLDKILLHFAISNE
jgi:hypothetical protein